MAYAVKFDIPERALGRTDIEFRVWEDDSALGTLLIRALWSGDRVTSNMATNCPGRSSMLPCGKRAGG